MRIGLINQFHGRPGAPTPPPSWRSISERARVAEEVGFDIFVFEDALMYRGSEHTEGVWESMTMAGALAAATDTIEIGHSVVNSPYRAPALVASMATTLDEISRGRYVLGVGAGNTPDSDYTGFGFPTDRRYSRFAEWLAVLHELLRSGSADFSGEFHEVAGAELVLRGPSADGPRINVAAGGERMLGLTARYADEWNWWAWDEAWEVTIERTEALLEALRTACFDAGRDPDSLTRTLDLYAIALPGADAPLTNPITGSASEIASRILALGELGFEEVRCEVYPKTPAGIEAMAPIVELVHAG